jgi:hypothetical protein
VLSVRPKITDLNFHLFARNVHPELFDVCARRVIERQNYRLELNITTDGHMIQFQHQDLVLSEISAGAHHPLPAKRLLVSHPISKSTTDELLYENVISYQSQVQREIVPAKVFVAIHQQLDDKLDCEGLVHRFDSNGRLSFGAMSYINVQAFRQHILLRTFHTFPDTSAVVKSETTFTIGMQA